MPTSPGPTAQLCTPIYFQSPQVHLSLVSLSLSLSLALFLSSHSLTPTPHTHTHTHNHTHTPNTHRASSSNSSMIVITMKFSHYLQSRTLRHEQSTIYSANIILILWWIMDISFLSEFYLKQNEAKLVQQYNVFHYWVKIWRFSKTSMNHKM